MNDTGKCCLCGGEYTMGGCNPDPVCTIPDARCCDKCAWERVNPARGFVPRISYEEHLAQIKDTLLGKRETVSFQQQLPNATANITIDFYCNTDDTDDEADGNDTQEKWDGIDDEPYVSVPLVLWDNLLIDNLQKASDATTGEVKSLINGLIHFCIYCKDEHTY